MTETGQRPPRKGDRRAVPTRRRARVRKTERRKAREPVLVERRSGVDRRQGERRSAEPRRVHTDRRAAAAAAAAKPSRLSARDRDSARRLADEIAAATGTLEQRVIKVTRRLWPVFPVPVRAGLAEALLPLLAPVVDGAPVNDALRKRCEELVDEWIGKYR